MAKLDFNAAQHAPTSVDDRVPALYSTLSASQRVAVRERYVTLQEGRCLHCAHALASDPAPSVLAMKVNWHAFPGRAAGFLRHPVHLHHCHKTDLTIGAVHAYCNAVLWQHHGE
jgi:hypothetical protein